MNRHPELVILAGSLEVLKTAVTFGADAVCIGGGPCGLCAEDGEFSLEEMAKGICFAHDRGVKVYVAVDILAHNSDIHAARFYLETLKKIDPDALIIADPGMFLTAREVWPEIDIHISAQANNVNYRIFQFWQEQGAKRVAAGQELSLEEIRKIREQVVEGLEIEANVHGAMCISYSGRYLLSNYLAEKDGSRDACAHSCRQEYAMEEETRPGEYMPVYENDRGTYIFNSRDLCMVEHIPDLIAAGVDCLKVRGRAEDALYTAIVTRAYRRALDDYAEDPALYRAHIHWYKEQVAGCACRRFTTGFFYGQSEEHTQNCDHSRYSKGYTYLGIAVETDTEGRCMVGQRSIFSAGESIEIMKPDGTDLEVSVESIQDAQSGHYQESATCPKQVLWVKLTQTPGKMDLLRRKD